MITDVIHLTPLEKDNNQSLDCTTKHLSYNAEYDSCWSPVQYGIFGKKVQSSNIPYPLVLVEENNNINKNSHLCIREDEHLKVLLTSSVNLFNKNRIDLYVPVRYNNIGLASECLYTWKARDALNYYAPMLVDFSTHLNILNHIEILYSNYARFIRLTLPYVDHDTFEWWLHTTARNLDVYSEHLNKNHAEIEQAYTKHICKNFCFDGFAKSEFIGLCDSTGRISTRDILKSYQINIPRFKTAYRRRDTFLDNRRTFSFPELMVLALSIGPLGGGFTAQYQYYPEDVYLHITKIDADIPSEFGVSRWYYDDDFVMLGQVPTDAFDAYVRFDALGKALMCYISADSHFSYNQHGTDLGEIKVTRNCIDLEVEFTFKRERKMRILVNLAEVIESLPYFNAEMTEFS